MFNLNEINGNLTFEKINEIDNPKFLDYPNNTECIILDNTAPDEPKLSVVLSNLLSSDYKVTTNNVTNAIKKINTDGAGNVILNLSFDSSESRKRSFTLFPLG